MRKVTHPPFNPGPSRERRSIGEFVSSQTRGVAIQTVRKRLPVDKFPNKHTHVRNIMLTTLDPLTALIVIDLQKGVVTLPTVHPAQEVVRNASALADAFRRAGLPVVLVNVTAGAPGRTEQPPGGQRPAGWTDLVPELNRQPQDHTVSKQTWGAFTRTDLEQHLRKLSVTQVVIIGISTSIGVESTARQAYEFGFNVTLAIDAMTDLRAEAHANSVARIFPRLGETGTTAEIIALVERTRA
ncbi:MAG TPA: isochorismatase family protein [Lacunisphaera sp.]|jgi:nicotinamidase-related amidase